MKTLRPLFTMLFLSFIAFVPISCGGGGGGGGGGVAGLNQVLITTTNADAIAENAFENSNAAAETGRDGGGIPSIESSDQAENKSSRPLSIALAQSMMDFLQQVDLSSGTAQRSTAGVSNIGTLDIENQDFGPNPGTCASNPGTVSGTGTYNDVTLELIITAIFEDYCTNGNGTTTGVVTNGTMVLSGQFNESANEITVTLTFSSFNTMLIETNASATMSGTMILTGDGDVITFTMDMVMSDDSTGKTYKIEDLIIVMFNMTVNSVDFTMDGRFHDPDYGYSDISTPTAFELTLSDNMPSAGVLVVTGADGVAGESTKAKLTIIDNTTYRVEADTTGDGNYDYDSGEKNW